MSEISQHILSCPLKSPVNPQIQKCSRDLGVNFSEEYVSEDGDVLSHVAADGSTMPLKQHELKRECLAYSIGTSGHLPGFCCRVWQLRVPRSGARFWWELPYIARALLGDSNKTWVTQRWPTWRFIAIGMGLDVEQWNPSRLSRERAASHAGTPLSEEESGTLILEATTSTIGLIIALANETHGHRHRDTQTQKKALQVLHVVLGSFFASQTVFLALSQGELSDPTEAQEHGLKVEGGCIDVSEAHKVLGVGCSRSLVESSQTLLGFTTEKIVLAPFLVDLITLATQRRVRRHLREHANCVLSSLQAHVDATWQEPRWQQTPLLDLPLLKTDATRHSRVPIEVKRAALTAVAQTPRISAATQLLAAKRTLSEGAGETVSEGQKKRQRLGEHWDWDCMYWYHRNTLRALGSSGHLCLSLDGARFDGEETLSMVAYTSRSKQCAWLPVQVKNRNPPWNSHPARPFGIVPFLGHKSGTPDLSAWGVDLGRPKKS